MPDRLNPDGIGLPVPPEPEEPRGMSFGGIFIRWIAPPPPVLNARMRELVARLQLYRVPPDSGILRHGPIISRPERMMPPAPLRIEAALLEQLTASLRRPGRAALLELLRSREKALDEDH